MAVHPNPMQQIADALARPDVRDPLIEHIRETIRYSDEMVEEWDEDRTYESEIESFATFNFAYLDEHVRLIEPAIRMAPQPTAVTAEELAAMAAEVIFEGYSDEWTAERGFDRFLDTVAAWDDLDERTHAFAIGRSLSLQLKRDEPFEWRSSSGFTLRIPADPGDAEGYTVPDSAKFGDPTESPYLASISGSASEAGFDQARESMSHVIASFARLMHFSGLWKFGGQAWSPFGKTQPHEFDMFRDALDLYFGRPRDKKSIWRALQRFLIYWEGALSAKDYSLQLTLAVAGLDAITGSTGEGQTIGERCAVILSGPGRRLETSDFIRRSLYNHRSKFIHGDEPDAPVQRRDVEDALRLAALMYRAMWELASFTQRLHQESSQKERAKSLKHDEILRSIDGCIRPAKAVTGVTENLIQHWRRL